MLSGYCAPGFGKVADFLRGAVPDLLPGGAACAAYSDGELVVDLWLGEAKPGCLWRRSTTAVLMSATKGVTALALQICVDRGLIDVERPVSDYWPEFGAAGKEGIRVSHVLSHTAGVPFAPGHQAVMGPPGREWDRGEQLLGLIAVAPPAWEPGTQVGYHGITYGLVLGEVLRGATGTTLREFVRAEIAEPLGLDLWVGVPPAARPRVAHVINLPPATTPEGLEYERRSSDPGDRLGAMMLALPGRSGGDMEAFFNEGPGPLLSMGGSTGVATARDLAGMYQALAHPSGLDGQRLVSSATVDLFRTERSNGIDAITKLPARWGLGYQLTGVLGFSAAGRESAFGHCGFGGQLGWADPESRVSGAFLRTRLWAFDVGDAFAEAVYACAGT